MPLRAERWRAVIPLLDRALDQSEAERAEWLAALRADDPTLASELEDLLARHAALSERGFLEQSVSTGPPRASLAGLRIGAYTLRSPIGQGGMGRAKLGAADAATAEVELALGECLLARGRREEARALAERSLPTLVRAHGEADARTLRARQLTAPTPRS